MVLFLAFGVLGFQHSPTLESEKFPGPDPRVLLHLHTALLPRPKTILALALLFPLLSTQPVSLGRKLYWPQPFLTDSTSRGDD